MRNIEKRILEFVALASPLNDNSNVALRPASVEAVNGLVNQLTVMPVVGKTYERTLGISLNSMRHTPWLDREISRKG